MTDTQKITPAIETLQDLLVILRRLRANKVIDATGAIEQIQETLKQIKGP